jgi:DNA-binding NtrC family response regulator
MSKRKANIIILDDDKAVLTTAKILLKQYYSFVQTEQNPDNLLNRLFEVAYDILLLDMNFKKGENDGKAGLAIIDKVFESKINIEIIVMTAYSDIDLAVRAIKKGGAEFITKPWENEKLLATINSILNLKKSKDEASHFKESQKRALGSKISGGLFVGQSNAYQRTLDIIKKVAPTEANVLLTGENGTGKEVAAQLVHAQSSRKDNIFLTIDLGSISNTLFESELFGHTKGAFTDAKEDRKGPFELTNGGTLFLDEIGNLDLHLQTKLLKVLQNRKVQRVGSSTEIPFDIRLICATNKNLIEMVKAGTFRQDLLYRINTVEIRQPSLAERKEDIPALTNHFISFYGFKYDNKILKLEKSVMKQLANYQWPGNIRELKHAVERAIILSDSNKLNIHNFMLISPPITDEVNNNMNLIQMEKSFIIKALEKHHGNVSRAAKELGIDRLALYRRMQKYGF